MEQNPSSSDILKDSKTESQTKGTLWAVAVMLGIVLVVVFLHRQGVSKDERETANEFLRRNIPAEAFGEGSPLILFTSEDVEVSTGWKLLSGLHPTVTFRCRLDSSVNSRVVVLCYRPSGSDQWQTVETRVRRDHTAKVVLRDLRRDTPYECFFTFKWQGATIVSGTVMVLG